MDGLVRQSKRSVQGGHVKRIILILLVPLLGACSNNFLAGWATPEDAVVAEVVQMESVARSASTEEATKAAVEAVLAEMEADEQPAGAGFFANLFGGSGAPEAPPAPDAQAPEDAVDPQIVETEPEQAGDAISDAAPAQPQTTPAPQRAGFFAGLFGGGRSEAETEETPTLASNSGGLSGLFGQAEPEPTGPDARRVPMDVLLPFGEIATNCEVTRRQLGTKVGEDAGYTLYDTIPNATALRTHYIMGFKDRCARQFTAATAIMGDIGTHEVVRYLPANRSKSYSVTDDAYEDIKTSYCGVGRGRPCGGRLDRLARRTVFISAYKRFTSSPDWSNILLHDGRVVAIGPK